MPVVINGITYANPEQAAAYQANFGGGGVFSTTGGVKPTAVPGAPGTSLPPVGAGPAAAGEPGSYRVKTERSPEADFLVDRWKGRMDDSVKRKAQESASDAVRQVGAGLSSKMSASLAERGLDDSGAGVKALGRIESDTAREAQKAVTDIELAEVGRQDALVMGGAGIASLPTKLMYEGQGVGNQTAQTGANIKQQNAQEQLAYLQTAYPQQGPAIVPSPTVRAPASIFGGSGASGPRKTGSSIFARR